MEQGPDLEKDGIVRWRRIDLKQWLEQEYGVKYHENSIGRIFHQLGFSRISVRPVHPKNNPALLED